MTMPPDAVLLIIYRLLALLIAAAMVVTMVRSRDWRAQLFAAIVFIPFALRAAYHDALPRAMSRVSAETVVDDLAAGAPV